MGKRGAGIRLRVFDGCGKKPLQPAGKLMCLDGKARCEPNKKPVGFCTGCGG